MKQIFVILVLVSILAGCWRFFPQPWAHGYPDIPWYLEPFLYCFITAAGG